MRKFFFWFGALAACVIVVGVAGFFYLARIGSALDKESRAYATATVAAVTSHWSAQELLQRASPALVRAGTAQMAAAFAWFGSLGNLVGQPDCKGSSLMSAFAGQALHMSARYVCTATYEHGDATIELGLVKLGQGWRVNGFRVDSPALLPRAAQKT